MLLPTMALEAAKHVPAVRSRRGTAQGAVASARHQHQQEPPVSGGKINPTHSPSGRHVTNQDLDVELFGRHILNNINGVPPREAQLKAEARHRHVLLACMPKSASTFLIGLMERLLGYAHVPLCFDFKRSEQDLYLPSILYYDHVDTVSQQHLRATPANIALIKAFDIKPIVLVRDIDDAIVSLRDTMLRETPHNLSSFIDDGFPARSQTQQMDVMVYYSAAWYVHFLVSWQEASRSGEIAPLWLT
jgi:hypothetical protein